MAIQELSKIEIETVSGGNALNLTTLVSGLSLTGGLLAGVGGLLAGVGGLLAGVGGLLAGVGGLLAGALDSERSYRHLIKLTVL